MYTLVRIELYTFTGILNNEYYGYNYKVFQPINSISREGPEEDKTITDIKFDIIYLNRFGEEMARIKNCRYEFQKRLGPGISLSLFGITGYNIEYSPCSDEGKQFENIRKNIDDFSYGKNGKIVSHISKVIFEGGQIFE